jgi:hypothetical protein
LTGLPRALSDKNLEEQPLQAQQDGFGANLDIPGSFLKEMSSKVPLAVTDAEIQVYFGKNIITTTQKLNKC